MVGLDKAQEDSMSNPVIITDQLGHDLCEAWLLDPAEVERIIIDIQAGKHPDVTVTIRPLTDPTRTVLARYELVYRPEERPMD